jgi:hypothetical protein
MMRLLAVITGDYGLRHVENIRQNMPPSWSIQVWRAPVNYPLVIDDPQDFLPPSLPETDLLLAFAEHKGVIELLPDLARLSQAKAVLAPVDNEAWLPRGLARQLHGWLERIGVACATPKPLCSLTENNYLVTRRQKTVYNDPWIAEFAQYFGKPELHMMVDPDTHLITSVDVKRDAVCGCAHYVAQKLVGEHVDEAELKAGLAHHHYPCLASMGIDIDFGDTLMHVSGNLLRDAVLEQIKPYKTNNYIRPGTHTEE